MKLFYDVETTGLLDFKKPMDDLAQPRIVQLAAIVTNDVGAEINCFSAIVEPTVNIPDGMCHGIDNDDAKRFGIPMKTALNVFGWFAWKCDELIAFNDDFDSKLIIGEAMRLEVKTPFGVLRRLCVMKLMTDICKIPKKKGFGNKWPNLTEAHQFCFKKGFDGAHDALADVRATIAIWKWHQENILGNKPKEKPVVAKQTSLSGMSET